jgi:glutamate carboxypeptidase
MRETGGVSGGAGDGVAVDPVLARIRRYVEHETPSGAATQLVTLSRLIEADLCAIGAVVQSYDAPGLGRNLLATLPGREETGPLLLLAHIDTVHPLGTLAQRPFRVEHGRAYGPGVYDMKAGLATAIEALAWLRERGRAPRRPVRLLVTCDEEIGSHSSRALIEEHAREAAAVLVLEPCMPDGGAKTFRKGVATYRVEAFGRAAHAGIDGAAAVSATAELVHALGAILELARHDRGTTVSIGMVGGGTASNVVAAEAWAVVDVRLAQDGEEQRVHGAMLALRARNPAARLAVRLTEQRPPLLRTPAVVALYQSARELAAGLGVDLPEGATGGGSDGSIAAAAGAATLDGLGPRGGGAHAVDEHILLDDLPFRVALLARLLESL